MHPRPRAETSSPCVPSLLLSIPRRYPRRGALSVREDERRRRGDRDEAEPFEDRATRGQRVGEEPAVAALARQLGAPRHRRAVEPPPAVLGQGDATEQAG